MARLETFLAQGRGEYAGMRLGLDRMREALVRAGRPERAFASVLIAGTNGKGSTARMVESVLRAAGYRTGLYTSPHLQRFSERIVVAGREIDPQALEQILADWEASGLMLGDGTIPVGEGERLTWFEKATLLAFEAFRRAGVAIAVLEVGLGGRHDATNATEPLVSAVVSIGMDHAEVLGGSLVAIAREKAGVMRMDRPVVVGPVAAEPLAALRAEAEAAGAQFLPAEPARGDASGFAWGDFTDLKLNLPGRHQLENAAVALEVLWALAVRGYPWPEEALRVGLAAASHPGRLERMAGKPPVLLDGAHNPPALRALADYLRENEGERKLAVVLAMAKEKDPEQALEILAPLGAEFFFTVFSNPRSLPLSRWREVAEARGLRGAYFEDPRLALRAAREACGPEGLVLVAGSLFLVGELREFA